MQHQHNLVWTMVAERPWSTTFSFVMRSSVQKHRLGATVSHRWWQVQRAFSREIPAPCTTTKQVKRMARSSFNPIPKLVLGGLAAMALAFSGGVRSPRSAAALPLPDLVPSITTSNAPPPPNWSVKPGTVFSYTATVRDFSDGVAMFTPCTQTGGCPALITTVPAGFKILAAVPNQGLACPTTVTKVTCYTQQIAAGKPVSVALRVLAPPTVGNYTITAQADPHNWVMEVKENNNGVAAPVTVQ